MKNLTKTFLVFALTIGLLSAPSLSLAKNDKGHENKSEHRENKGKAWGHFIAPGWLKKHNEDRNLSDYSRVPFGIFKKMNKDHDDDNQDDQTGDTSAPRIFSIFTKNIHETGAQVVIFTNEKAIVSVEYGTTNTYGSETTETTDFKAFNVVDLTGLTANTTYHYKVTVEDKDGNSRTSGDRMFKTKEVIDVEAPIISALSVSTITDAGATITWTTNENSDSKVDYGVNDTYGTDMTNADMVTSHSMVLVGLTENTTYHFKITSKDSDDNSSASADMTFKTLYTDQTDPIISNINVSAVTQTGATVAWETDEDTTSTIYWSTVTNINQETAFKNVDAVLKTDNTFNITGLSADTAYYFEIVSTDESENSATSAEGMITTLN